MLINFINTQDNSEDKNPIGININQKCIITNRKKDSETDTNEENFKLEIKKTNSILTIGENNQTQNNDIKVSNVNSSIFQNIALLDGNGDDLSQKDLQLAKEQLNKGILKPLFKWLGIKNFEYDDTTGKALIQTDESDIEIDFETETEKKRADAERIQNIIGTGRFSYIKKEWFPYIQKVSEETGLSMDFILHVLSTERLTSVAVAKKDQGLIEVGFGHTTKANSNTNFKPGYKITIEQAFEWFAQDLKDKEAELKKLVDLYHYDDLPQSLKEELIDVAYNRGEDKLSPDSLKFDKNYISLIQSVEKGDYASATVQARQEKMNPKYARGLKKRNIYRFLVGIRDLAPEEQLRAMEIFDKDKYYTNTLKLFNKKEADTIRIEWETVRNNAISQLSINEEIE